MSDKLRGKTKVKRYWPGKAPEWADDADADGDIRMILEDSDVVRKDDPRLRRLAESSIDNLEEVRADHRRIRQAEILSTEEEDDEEALEERRRRIKEKSRLREPQEDAEEEDDEEEEYETNSKEKSRPREIFVAKAERETIAERQRLRDEERALEEKERKKLEERKVETKQILVEEIRKEQLIRKNLESEASIADVDADDEVNEAEYEAWKVREIARMKRDREASDAKIAPISLV